MTRICICGICGRMGKRIAELALDDGSFILRSGLEREDHPSRGEDIGKVLGKDNMDVVVTSDINESISDVDCVIDFTVPGSTVEHLQACLDNEVPIVIGTTGLGQDIEKVILDSSGKIPVVFSPNMAPGVNVFFNIVSIVSKTLGQDFEIEIDETHHVHKKDAPSGTAKMIARLVKDASGKDVPVDAKREGEVIGNHGVVFDGKYETLEIRHNAKSRDVFAAAALKAAKFVTNKPPGLYTMADVLGLKGD